MADTLQNASIPQNDWVDLYALTGLAVGTQLTIENSGVCDVYLAVQATKPDKDHSAYNIVKRAPSVNVQNTEGDAGAWAYCQGGKGKLSISSPTREGFMPVNRTNLHDGYGNPIDSFKGGVDVHIADAHDRTINEFFFKITDVTTTLASDVAAQDRVITAVSSTGFADGDPIDLAGSTVEESTHPIIIDVTGNDITLDRPLDSGFTAGDTVTKLVSNMAVDGSVTPVSFKLSPHIDENWHILRFLINMNHGSAADDSKFGSLTALLRGVLLRKFDGATGKYYTYTNWKTNGDMVTDMYDVLYGDKAGPGLFSTRGRFSVKIATEAVPKIDYAAGDYLEVLVQDKLDTLTSFSIKSQGHVAGA